MKVIKIGGGCLKDGPTAKIILDLAAAMTSKGIESEVVLPEEAGIITDGKYMDATALMAPTRENLSLRLGRQVTENKILFVPGFYGISESGEITTFGRGGSDYSAAVVTAGVNADLLEIWKDTPGFMTADPDNIPECRLIPELTYEKAAAHACIQAIHPRPFRESSYRTRVALVSIVGEGLHLSRGIAARCFTAVYRANVNIEMISFGASDAAMYFLVHEDSLDDTIQALHKTFFN